LTGSQSGKLNRLPWQRTLDSELIGTLVSTAFDPQEATSEDDLFKSRTVRFRPAKHLSAVALRAHIVG